MNPYENIQIGNFLISLGYNLHKLNKPLIGSINLLQQTPLDAKVGDLLGNLNGKYFIIEFKRNFELLKSEFSKPKYHKLQSLLKGNIEINDLACKVHLLSYGYETTKREFEYRFISYFYQNKIIDINSISNFIERLFNSEIGLDLNDFKNYVTWLNNSSQSGSNSSTLSSKTINSNIENMCGLVVIMDENKLIRHLVFQSLDELNLLLNLKIEHQKTVKKGMTRNFNQDKGIGGF